jgi:carboxyl-terminal processing protease
MPRPPFPRLFSLGIALVFLAAGCTTAPTEYREPLPLTAAERSAANLRVFERTWELVNEKYFDAKFRGVDWPAMRTKYRQDTAATANDDALYLVLNRLCAELKESHLAALAPRRAHEIRTEHRASVGFRIQQLEAKRVVTEVLPGSPAAIAGVQSGWLVVERNGAPLSDTDPYLPKLGQPVSYTFLDAGDQAHTLTMEPQLLDFHQQVARELPGNFRYLRFDEFDHKSLHWLSEQLKTRPAAPGVVLDLRNNPGGNVLALKVALAEFFFKKVAAGRTIRRNGQEHENESFSWLSAHYAGRVIILTDNSTGSAAEIFSHVLQHNQRATVIGRRTAGAVIVSRLYDLPGGGKLQVPVSDYIGLDGQRLEGRGVTPDVALPAPTLADLRIQHDPDLEAALHALQKITPSNTGQK